MQWLVQELWRQHRPAVLLITHDVGEAILLADRIVVLREHRIALDLRVTLDRPRRSGVEFSKLADLLLAELGVLKDDEQNKFELDLAS
jgi:sulfonate transport system ATP-binding protein